MADIIELDFVRRYRPKRPQADIECRVRQEDLGELMALRQRAHLALKELRERQDVILWHLLNEIPVEPGPLSARLQLVTRETKMVRGARYYRLVVK